MRNGAILEYANAYLIFPQIDGITGKSLTFSDLITFSQRLANALYRRGLRKGDTLMIVCPNTVEYPVCVFGTLYIGGILTTCSPLYTEGQAESGKKQCGPVITRSYHNTVYYKESESHSSPPSGNFY